MPNTINSARRMIPIRMIGLGTVLANNASAVTVPIPAGANAFYYGGTANLTFDGVAASASSGITLSATNLGEPVLIPQSAPSLSLFGVGSATYVQFCQVSC